MNIQELKLKSSEQLITQAEELGIEMLAHLESRKFFLLSLRRLLKKRKLQE